MPHRATIPTVLRLLALLLTAGRLRTLAGCAVTSASSVEVLGQQETAKPGLARSPAEPQPGHERRKQWWRDAKFRMFIHWGLYSLWTRGEWVLAM